MVDDNDGGATSPGSAANDPDFDGASWPTFGGGPRRRGRAADGTGPESGGSVTWTTAVGDASVYGPVVDGDTLFYGGGTQVAAYAAGDGSERWATGGWTMANTPQVVDGSLYVPNDDDGLRAVDPQSGEEQWSLGSDSVAASPTVQDGTLYAVVFEEGVVAVDADTGEREGTTDTELGHALAAGGDRRYLRSQRSLSVLSGGAVTETVALPPAQTGYPVVGDGLVYAAGCDDRQTLVAVDPAAGERAWTQESAGECGVSGVVNPALADGSLVWGTGDEVTAVDPSSGDEQWTTTLDSPRGVAVGGETAYVAQGDGSLVALSLANGDERWRVSVERQGGVGTAQPMVVGDRVYHQVGRQLAAVDPA